MSQNDETIAALREALELTPENTRLRRHLAETLRGAGRYDEAEEEFRAGLQRASGDRELKLGLARTYLDRHKHSHAMVVLESLLLQPDAPAEALVLSARIKLAEGDVSGAVSAYREALDADASAEDPALSEQLGVYGEEPEEEPPAGEVREGKILARAPSEIDVDRIVERPTIRFEDVGGMESVKEEIDIKIIQPLLQPELFASYGKSIGGGILLYGPPGCGKTHLARATAGQVDAQFMSIGLHDVLDMYVGQSERNLHALFQRARSATPFVLFFDEVDALGSARSSIASGSMRMTVNQFLEELDGAEQDNDGVLVLAATNAPWHLDAAFRRPGRFDRIIFVPPPDEAARIRILQVLLKDKPAEGIDYRKLGKKTDGFSGADLKGLVEAAIEDKLREAIRTSKSQPVTTRDLLGATRRVKPSTREWFATARNYVLYSNEGGLYDDVARYMNL